MGGEVQPSELLLSMNDFANYKQIGKGKDCVVYAASCEKLGGHTVVLKVYDKAKISAIKHRSVRREARIMRYLTDKRIPHTTAYTGAFQDSKQIYIVMEHCKGGDLLEQLLKEGRAMPEKRVVREVVLPTLTALAHLHAAGIIHRDIKLENLFISSRGHLQLGDFGLAISVLEERAISPVGTLEYMAPEILRLPSTDLVIKGMVRVEDIAPIDEKVDVWSFGVTVYELVTGRSPFEGSSKDEIKAAILGFQMRSLPAFLTPGCQDFILKCLCPKPADRPSALTLLSHPWVQLHCTPADLVTIARLPLQLPKVPMGYKQQQQQQQPAAASTTQQQQQQGGCGEAVPSAAAQAASNCSSTTITAVPSLANTPRDGPAAAAASTAADVTAAAALVGAGRKPKIHANSSSNSSPDSPQICAFMPPASPASPGCVSSGTPCSSASVASAACTHIDSGRTCSSSRCSNSSSMMQTPAGMASHGQPSIDHTVSTESVRSNSALTTMDSVASMYQQSLAAAATNIINGHHGSSSSSQQYAYHSSKAWAATAAAAAAAPPAAGCGWPQEPIQESPTDESAAAAASMAGNSGRHDSSASFSLQQQQQHHLQQQQFLQQPLEAACLPQQQQPHKDASVSVLERLSSAKALGGQQRHKKSHQHGGGKRLFKRLLCIASGASSPNVSS